MRRAAQLLYAAVTGEFGKMALRAETWTDIGFLDDLAAACSPLAGLTFIDIICQQAVLQRLGHTVVYPNAMRRIVMRQGRPIDRMMIFWTLECSRCIDISIAPADQGQGLGTALLGSWPRVADRLRIATALSVRRENPAVALYRRLGFVELDDECGAMPTPMLEMVRPL